MTTGGLYGHTDLALWHRAPGSVRSCVTKMAQICRDSDHTYRFPYDVHCCSQHQAGSGSVARGSESTISYFYQYDLIMSTFRSHVCCSMRKELTRFDSLITVWCIEPCQSRQKQMLRQREWSPSFSWHLGHIVTAYSCSKIGALPR